MFERPESQERSKLWTYLLLAGLLLAAAVALIAILARPEAQTSQTLTNLLHAGDPDFDWYSKYVSLEKSDIKMAKSFSGKRMVIFTGVIRNDGEKVLDAVEVKLLFINRDKPIHEVIKTPVQPGPYSPPIASLESRAFTLYVEDFPPAWLATRAEMEVYGFRFQQPAGE